MVVRRVVVSVLAPFGGVDMRSPGQGVGPAVAIAGSHSSVTDSEFFHDDDCGSNVSPLLQVSGAHIQIKGNRFWFGCTLYSVRSATHLLWRNNTATHYGGRQALSSVAAGCQTRLRPRNPRLFKPTRRIVPMVGVPVSDP
eukprot:m.430030 g.430030  ORF g.430030 m.430030 type:complete len:140 (-) comp21391_c1_seq3:2718-3137(-)